MLHDGCRNHVAYVLDVITNERLECDADALPRHVEDWSTAVAAIDLCKEACGGGGVSKFLTGRYIHPYSLYNGYGDPFCFQKDSASFNTATYGSALPIHNVRRGLLEDL